MACAGTPVGEDPREHQLARFFAHEHQTLATTRPHQLNLRFDEMAKSPFRFLRGTEPLFFRDLHDPSLGYPLAPTFDTDPSLSLLQGDAHPENLGVYGGIGEQHLELNDFDAAGFGPFHWEVLRAASSLVVALTEAGVSPAVRSQCAGELARAYADTIKDPAVGTRPLGPTDVGEVIRRRFDKGIEDGTARGELNEFTVLDHQARRLKRGNTDPQDLSESLLEVDPTVAAAIPDLLSSLRQTLWQDDHPDTYFAVKDVARRCGQGVGSLSAVRLYILLEGPSLDSDDDVVVQLKEATDASLDYFLPYGAFNDNAAERVVLRTRALQSRPDADPLLGHAVLFGVPVVSRTIEYFQKTIRISDLERVNGEPAALARFARDFGAILANTHGRSVAIDGSPAAPHIDLALFGRREAFVGSISAKAVAYASLLVADHGRFLHLRTVLGPDLGLRAHNSLSHSVSNANDPYLLLDPPCP